MDPATQHPTGNTAHIWSEPPTSAYMGDALDPLSQPQICMWKEINVLISEPVCANSGSEFNGTEGAPHNTDKMRCGTGSVTSPSNLMLESSQLHALAVKCRRL